MNRHGICASARSAANVLTRKSLQSNSRVNVKPSKKQPVLISERLNYLEKQFETVLLEVKSSKNELTKTTSEIAQMKKVCIQLQEELTWLEKKFESTLDELKTQLLDDKNEEEITKRENAELRPQLNVFDDKSKKLRDEFGLFKERNEQSQCDSSDQSSCGSSNASKVSSDEKVSSRLLFQSLPCKTITEFAIISGNPQRPEYT